MRKSTRKKGMIAVLTDDQKMKDRSFDLTFWSTVDDQTKFAAAWELVRLAWKTKGKDLSELRFNRSIAVLKHDKG